MCKGVHRSHRGPSAPIEAAVDALVLCFGATIQEISGFRQTYPGNRRRKHHGKVHLRHRRRRILTGQGHHRSVPGTAAQGPGLLGHQPEVRSLSERRPRHHEPLPARRGVRHRGRHGDRPGSGPLRALHRRKPDPGFLRHLRPDLLVGAEQGARRRVQRRHGADHPPRHQRDQEQAVQHRQGQGRGHHRDRRHHRRHRGPVLHRGAAPVPVGGAAGGRAVHPRHADPLPEVLPGAQDQAHPALRQAAPVPGHPAEHAGVPQRLPRAHGDAPEAGPVLQCAREVHHPEPGRGVAVSGAADAGKGELRRQGVRGAAHGDPQAQPRRLGAAGEALSGAGEGGHHRAGGQVHRAARRVPLRGGGAAARRHRPQRPGAHQVGAGRRAEPRGRGSRRDFLRRAGHSGSRRLRQPWHRGQAAGGAVRARARHALPGHLPGSADRGDRIHAARLRSGEGLLHRV